MGQVCGSLAVKLCACGGGGGPAASREEEDAPQLFVGSVSRVLCGPQSA